MRSALLSAALVLAASGCDLLQPKVSQAKLEEALKAWLVDHDLEAKEIHCPDNQKMEKGNVFECTCEVHGATIPVRVEVTDPTSGTVEWKPKYLTMKGEEFAKEIKARPQYAKHDLTIKCSDKVLVSIPDSEWTCDITDNTDKKTYVGTVKFTDGEGTHDLNIKAK